MTILDRLSWVFFFGLISFLGLSAWAQDDDDLFVFKMDGFENLRPKSVAPLSLDEDFIMQPIIKAICDVDQETEARKIEKRKQIIEELKSMSARRTVTSSCNQLVKNEQSVSSENFSQSCFANHIKNYLGNHSRKVLFVFRKLSEEERNEILNELPDTDSQIISNGIVELEAIDKMSHQTNHTPCQQAPE
jgi:hypothetical protein